MHFYIAHDNNFFTVGHYAVDGKFIPESDHSEREKAAERVAFLNGTVFPPPTTQADELTTPTPGKILREAHDHFQVTLDNGTNFSIRVLSSGLSIYKFVDPNPTAITITLAADNHIIIK